MKETGIEGLGPREFEQQLTQALRHVDAPGGFADRVMASTVLAEKIVPARPRLAVFKARAWAGGAVAAILALGIFAGIQMRVQRHHQEQAVVAQQEFDTAMRVTDRALDRTRAQVLRTGLTLDK